MGRKPKPGTSPVPGELRWKLKAARVALFGTDRSLAATQTGYGNSTIGAYEAGGRPVPNAYIDKLSDIGGIPIEWFRDGKSTNPPIAITGTKSTPPPTEKPNPVVSPIHRRQSMHINLVPYWGPVPAGNWQSPPTETDWIQVSESVDTDGVIAVRVTGDSMQPKLSHGQLVCIKLDKEPRDGVISLLRNQDNELTLKVPHHVPGRGWEFRSINPAYESVTAEQVMTLGYAISIEETNPHGIRP